MNRYSFRARVTPGLLVLTPVCVTAAAIAPGPYADFLRLLPVVGGLIAIYPISHLVRRIGRARQPRLWKSWSGPPTTVMLRWNTEQPADIRELNRGRLARVACDLRLSSPEEERTDPLAADRSYEAAVSVLREKTRNKQRFPIVFAENVSYGYRRNAWAIRPLGVLTSGLSLVCMIWSVALSGNSNGDAAQWAVLIADGLFLLFWLFGITKESVKQAADDYARALFAAAAVLLDEDDR